MAATAFATPLGALDAVALDTETTGLDPGRARVVQIGAVRLEGGDRFEALVDPGGPIPPASSAVHGITDADVAGAPRFAEVAVSLSVWLGGAVLVGHTVAYDLAVLAREHELAGLAWAPPVALDVRLLARLASPGLMHDDLDRLCAGLGIAIEGRHTAMGDALATAAVFRALVPMLRKQGIRTLAEAQAASRALAERQGQGGLVPGGLVPGGPVPGGMAAPAALERIDSFPYRHRVAEVMTAPPLVVAAEETLAGLIATLSGRGVSSAFVRLPAGWGIVTERDVLRALHRKGAAALGMAVGGFASAPLQTVGEGDFVYRAIGRLGRLGLRHLGVTGADGALVGALTPRNLLRQRGSAAILLGDAIDSASGEAELGRAWAQVPAMARLLLAEGVEARQVAAVISAEVCAMTRRAAELAEAALAAEGQAAPGPYCVMVLGSAGRGESLLAADQDNAIVHAGGEAAEAWCAALGARMNVLLDEVGIPLCKGGVMAREPAWRHSAAEWRAVVAGWVRRQRPEDLLNVDIFFDAVPVHGDAALAGALLAEARAMAAAAPDFLKLMAVQAAGFRAPLGLLGGLRRDGGGRTDLKMGGLLPIVAGARVLALRHGVDALSTPARLREVAAKGIGAARDIEAVLAAHGTILGAVLAQQLADAEAGVALSPRIDPQRPWAREVPAALRQVATIAGLVTEGRM